MRIAEYLWVEVGDPPPEYIDLILCRDVYHCTPSELDQQDAERIEAHLICLNLEERVRKRDAGDK